MFRCSVVWAVFKRNLASYFSGVLGALIIVVFVAGDTIATFSAEFFANNLATLDQLTAVYPQLLLFLVPAITMGVWAEERRQGTDELLFTMPATDVEVLLGKYVAVLAVYSIAMLFTVPKLFVLAYYADPDWALILTTYLGYWLAGAALLSAGMFASSLTSSTTAAYVLGSALCAIPVSIGLVSFGSDVIESLALERHLGEFGVGLVPLGGLVYFASFTLLMLYLNYVVITKRHWAADRSAGMGLHFAVRVLCLVCAIVAVNYAIRRGSDAVNLSLDATSEGLHTLSDETHEVVTSIPEQAPVEIRAFISPNLPRDYVDHGRALERLLSQYRRIGSDRLIVRRTDTLPFTEHAEEAETFGITPRTVDYEDQTGQRSDDIFLGAVVSGPRGEVVVPFFETSSSVEYELTRAISTVTQRERLVVGLLSTPVADMLDQGQAGQKSRIVTLLEKNYEVDNVFPASPIELDREVEFEIFTDADENIWKAWLKQEAERKAAEEAEKKAAEKKAAEEAAAKQPEDEADPPEGDAPEDPADDDPTTDDADPKPADDAAADPDGAADPKADDAPEKADEPEKQEEPPRAKPDGRSKYLKADPTKAFDDKQIPEEVRNIFGRRGINLSADAKLTVREPGRSWSIDDVNPSKTYEISKGKTSITVTFPRYDVLLAIMPSALTTPEMDNLVDYVKTGRPVLVFDDPLPLHVGGFLGLEQSPVRPRRAEQPQRPGMPPAPAPAKADDGKALSLMRALGVVWEHDEAVWDEYDPHPKFREFQAGRGLEIPLLYVNRDNGTKSAFSADSPVTAGLHELMFIYPGRINPRSESRFDFQPLVRVGPESGTYEWDDLVETQRVPPNPFQPGGPSVAISGMQSDPKKTIVEGERPSADEEPERIRRFCLAAHITAPRSIHIEVKLPNTDSKAMLEVVEKKLAATFAETRGIDGVETKLEVRGQSSYALTTLTIAADVPDAAKKSDDDAAAGDDEPKKADSGQDVAALVASIRKTVGDVSGIPKGARVTSSTARNAIFVADVDMLGYIPLVFVNDDPEERVDFQIDNATFVFNAIDVLAGRNELVRLQSRRPRHRIITEVERRKQTLDAEMTDAIRKARAEEEQKIEDVRELVRKKQERLDREEGLSSTERFQEQVVALSAASQSLDTKLEKIEADTELRINKLRAENGREVRSLQNSIRTRAILYSLAAVVVIAIIWLEWISLSERSHVDPKRTR